MNSSRNSESVSVRFVSLGRSHEPAGTSQIITATALAVLASEEIVRTPPSPHVVAVTMPPRSESGISDRFYTITPDEAFVSPPFH